VAKSKVRKKAVYTPPQRSQKLQVSPRWVAPAMVAAFLVGLAWIATYYVTAASSHNVPVLSPLGNWNLLIGFTLIIGGLGLATKWR
jgi:hypothetical protein